MTEQREKILKVIEDLEAVNRRLYEPGNNVYTRAADMLRELDALLNAPELIDFRDAVVREAAHQRARWGTEHDEGKDSTDWAFLVGFLVGKAVNAHKLVQHNQGQLTESDHERAQEKYLHHIITAAAACANWHAHASGEYTDMRPGIEDPDKGN